MGRGFVRDRRRDRDAKAQNKNGDEVDIEIEFHFHNEPMLAARRAACCEVGHICA
jgi:hypothetical protein